MEPRTSRPVSRFSLPALAAVVGIGLGAWSVPDAQQAPLLVTSSLGATSAILFLVDPAAATLSCYEAIPGAEGGLRWLGARKIENDLKLTRYRDLSEFSYSELRDQYEAQATPPEQPDRRK
jgi:hypothetical protein